MSSQCVVFRLSAVLVAICGLLLLSCAGPDTTVLLAVEYEDAWELTALELTLEGRTQRVDPVHRILLRFADSGEERQPLVAVRGLRDAAPYASGRGPIQIIPTEHTEASVALARLPCGAWCTAGSTQCEGDGVAACAAGDDGCMDWGVPAPCPPDAPSCSLGRCAAECIDECAEGDAICAGPAGVRRCGQADSDPCVEWLAPVACADGAQCSEGRCAAECAHECEAGARECRNGGVLSCGDRNLDGCMEWGPVEPCAAGQGCEGGACAPLHQCEDECAANACRGDTLTRCGNYDLDPCLEPSAGTSCVPADPCVEGRCTGDGCESAPRVCSQPPQSQCTDDHTLRVYDATGACRGGTCEYAAREQACPGCPLCDACAGVACDQPPTGCYLPTGTCAGGQCTYVPADGAQCDDRDACTANDRCASGACAGTAIACTAPPSPECVGAGTLRTYQSPGSCSAGGCVYPSRDTSCVCAAGACCVPETDAQLCMRTGTACGMSTRTDNCGVSRTVDCGACGSCGVPVVVPPTGRAIHGTTSGQSTVSSECGGGATAPEHVFAWTPSVSGTALVSTCGTSFDTVLDVHHASCSGVSLGCNDDSDRYCSTRQNHSDVEFEAVAGRTYYVTLDGISGGHGNYRLLVIAPGGDCDHPFPIAPAGGPHSFTMTGRSTDIGSCGGSGVDRVHRWRPERSGTATVRFNGDFWPTTLYVRSGTCRGAELACDHQTGDWPTNTVSFQVTAGTDYYIWVSHGDYNGEAVMQYDMTVTPP